MDDAYDYEMPDEWVDPNGGNEYDVSDNSVLVQ
jgi:hypothetical protein